MTEETFSSLESQFHISRTAISKQSCPYVLIKLVKLLAEKRTLKASFLFQKQHESESLAEVQCVIWQLSFR